MASHQLISPVRRLAAFLIILLALACPGSPAMAAGEPQVQLIPAVSGYPAGQATPMLLLLTMPPDAELELSDLSKTFDLSFPGQDEIRPAGIKVFPASDRPGQYIMVLDMAVPPAAIEGPRILKGDMDLVLKDGKHLKVDLALPMEVLPVGVAPKMVSKEMFLHLIAGGSAPGKEAYKDVPEVAMPEHSHAEGEAPHHHGEAQQDEGHLAAATGGTVKEIPAKDPAAGGNDPLAGLSLWLVLATVFIAGLGLNLTPCVYPLIPITVSFFGGRAQGSRTRLVADALAYWAGLALMYSALGAVVALSGGMLGEALMHPAVTVLIAVVFLAMALSMFGLWELRLPASLNRAAGASRSGLAGSFFMGLLLGVLAAPCVGPFVVALMTHVARVGEVGYGFVVFLFLALGLGLPLTVLALMSGSIKKLPGAGDWMIWVRCLFGVVLVIMAIFVLRPLMGEEAFRWLAAGVGLIGAIYLGFLQKTAGSPGFMALRRILGVIALIAAAAFWWYSAPLTSTGQYQTIPWQKYSKQTFEKALASGKPVLVDFTAAWCPPCRQMDQDTFPEEVVIKALQDFVPIKMDVTSGMVGDAQRLAQRWGVRGVPTLVFLAPGGRHLKEMNIVGFIGPEDFVQYLKRVRMAAGG